MGKLLALLGKEAYEALKAAMGDAFAEFEKLFEDSEIAEADVIAKQTELGLLETEEDEDKSTGDDGDTDTDTSTDDDTSTEKDTTEDEALTGEESTTEPTSNTSEGILLDGWLLDSGDVDYDKITDVTLRDYLKGIGERLKRVEWDYKYKMAILVEAMKSNMFDTSDAEKYIDTNNFSTDDSGNVIGVKEAFDKLKTDKPHLFKAVTTGSANPLDSGFNPVDYKVTSKPKSYAEAVEQTRALVSN